MDNTNEKPATKEMEITIRILLLKYLVYWPWFLLSIICCVLLGLVYIHFAVPVYQVSASVQIKDQSQKKSFDWENLNLESLSSGSSNIEDEATVFLSESNIEQVVLGLHLYCTYSSEGRYLYRHSPFFVEPLDLALLSSAHPIRLTFSLTSACSGEIEVLDEISDKVEHCSFTQLPFVAKTSLGSFEIISNPDKKHVASLSYPCELIVQVTSLFQTVKSYQSSLNVSPKSNNSSILSVTLKTEHLERGKDFVKTLIDVYNLENNNYKNEMATKTGEFISERLDIINQELGSTEEELATFKQKSGLTNLTSDAQLALNGNAEYNKLRVENSTQISLVRWLKEHLQNSALVLDPVPQNVGIKDVNLMSQVERYNELLIERKRLLRSSTENNPRILDLDTSIQAMRQALTSTTGGSLKTLLIVKSKLDQESSRFDRRITNAPKLERRLIDISRRQEIKSDLYLMLLQKREENAITLSASTNTARLIGWVSAGSLPISPKSRLVYLISICLGLFLPVGGIWLYEQFKIRLDSVESINEITTLPLLGKIPLVRTQLIPKEPIVIFKNENTIVIEAFRRIRSNLKFMMLPHQKVILATSTTCGEGKTFFLSNLAVSLSLLTKKVLVVGLDVRNPRLNNIFQIPKSHLGITSYLSNPTLDLFSFIYPHPSIDHLSILPCGIVPPNPSELLSRDCLKDGIEKLKEHYDYILIDAAPYGLVSDTLSLSILSDLCVYVCRADYTLKTDFRCVNQWAEKYPNTCIVLNGIDLRKRNISVQ